MKIVGLTGGIGSGKSTVAQMFEDLGIPVYYSDDRAKQLMVESRSLREKIVDRFGDRAYDEKGLNTEFLAGVVFHDRASLEALNRMVHPEVEKDFRDWAAGQRAAYVIQENPLLFEKNKQDQYDYVIVVTASTETRINRVISRDGVSRDEVKARIQNQMQEDKKVALATYVIENDEDLESCRESVLAVHQHILSRKP